MDKPKESAPSLVVAWDVQRKNRAKSSTPTDAAPRPSFSKAVEEIERPGSLVDAILAKRKAAQPEPEAPAEEDDGYGEPLMDVNDDFLDLNDDDYKEPDISTAPKKLPFPTSRADAIRAKLKATRGF
jgi:hypothetical protein